MDQRVNYFYENEFYLIKFKLISNLHFFCIQLFTLQYNKFVQFKSKNFRKSNTLFVKYFLRQNPKTEFTLPKWKKLYFFEN
jgi:hypothetical protein